MKKLTWMMGLLGVALSSHALSMGLRSFVALPLEQGGMVFRLQDFGHLQW